MVQAIPATQLQDGDDAEALPTDGMDVEETRDADTVRLFVLEWRRRLRHVSLETSSSGGQARQPDGMIDT